MSEEKKLKPFFTKFMEENTIEEMDKVKGGTTMKYPSDDDWIG